jgi:hypothetical protein
MFLAMCDFFAIPHTRPTAAALLTKTQVINYFKCCDTSDGIRQALSCWLTCAVVVVSREVERDCVLELEEGIPLVQGDYRVGA